MTDQGMEELRMYALRGPGSFRSPFGLTAVPDLFTVNLFTGILHGNYDAA